MSASGIYFANQNNKLLYRALPASLGGLDPIETALFDINREPIIPIPLTEKEVNQKTPTQKGTDHPSWIEGTAIPNVLEATSDESPPTIQPIPNPAVIEAASKANKLLEETVAKDPIHTEENWVQRTLVVNFFEVTSDVSYAARSIDSLANLTLGQNDSPWLQAAGITSCFSIISGYVSGCRSYEKMQQAQKINDFWGEVIGGIKTTCGAARVVTGFIFLPLRGLSFAVTYTAIKSTAVAMALGVIGAMGTGLGILVSILIGLPSVITFFKTISFEMKFNEKLNDPDPKSAIAFLIDQLQLTDDDYSEILSKISEQEATDIPIDEEDEKLLTAQDWDFISQHPKVNGLTQALINAKKTKEAEFERNTSSATLTLVKDAIKGHLLFRLENNLTGATEEAKKIIGQAKDDMLFNKIFHGAIIAACVLGVVGLLLGTIFTGGAPIIVSAVLLALSALLFLGVDGYCFFKGKEVSDFKDKLLIYLISLVVGAACIAGTVLSAGIGPMIVCGLLLISIIILLVYDEYRCYKRDKEIWELRNPGEEKA